VLFAFFFQAEDGIRDFQLTGVQTCALPILPWRVALRRDWVLYAMAILPLLFLAVFRYVPMAGNVIAFRRFRPGSSIFGDEWVGLHYVQMFLSDPNFWRAFWNTVILGGLTLIVIFPLPIALALMLNELRSRKFKRVVQTDR